MIALHNLTDEMHAVRHALLDEQPVSLVRVDELLDGLQQYEEWLMEQRRTNPCVEVPKTPAPLEQEAVYQISSTWLTPETIADWKRKGWIK